MQAVRPCGLNALVSPAKSHPLGENKEKTIDLADPAGLHRATVSLRTAKRRIVSNRAPLKTCATTSSVEPVVWARSDTSLSKPRKRFAARNSHTKPLLSG